MERGVRVAGRYEVLTRLGRGGMGEVWAARDHMLHRDIALKLLDLNGAEDAELVQRFEREAVAAAQISHPNVVALHDKGTHEDMLFIVMEKVEGGTLTEAIRRGNPMSLERALAIADEICLALAAAHEARVIHYDIKPHNVMLTPDGRVKVVDFGIAGFIQATFTVANSSQLTPAGTIEYGAPEQFLNERGDERSDLYALGGVLFAMLAGRPPFTGQNAVAVLRSKLDEDAPRLDSLRHDAPPAVTALIAELLDRAPDRRPQTAHAVHERLQRMKASEAPTRDATPHPQPTMAEPPPPRTRKMTDAPQQADPGGPFTISWTGSEPLDSYLDTEEAQQGTRRWMTGFTACAVIAVAMWISLASSHEDYLTAIFGIAGGIFSLFAIFALWVLIAAPNGKRAWSLQVGPPGIRITRGDERHEYRWENVQNYLFDEPIESGGLRGTGLIVKFTDEPITTNAKGEEIRKLDPYIKSHNNLYNPNRHADIEFITYEPAGLRGNTVKLQDTQDMRVPLCVFGPMTDQQKAALRAALARYAPGKSDAEAWGE